MLARRVSMVIARRIARLEVPDVLAFVRVAANSVSMKRRHATVTIDVFTLPKIVVQSALEASQVLL